MSGATLIVKVDEALLLSTRTDVDDLVPVVVEGDTFGNSVTSIAAAVVVGAIVIGAIVIGDLVLGVIVLGTIVIAAIVVGAIVATAVTPIGLPDTVVS